MTALKLSNAIALLKTAAGNPLPNRSLKPCVISQPTLLDIIETLEQTVVDLQARPCPQVIDLLRKYIWWVGQCEGVNYIDSGTYYHEEKTFAAPEWATLQRLAKERP